MYNEIRILDKMTTVGDRVLNISLPKIGEKSLFTKDLEDALNNGAVDFVVHSLKDLPTSLPPGMTIGAVLKREDARDALVLKQEYAGQDLSTLPKDSVIGMSFKIIITYMQNAHLHRYQNSNFLGTSSLRRTAQINRLYPHLVVRDIRGNLNTRLAKLDAKDSTYAGIILAQAGLIRMGWKSRINQILDPNEMSYAVGQGALAVECRKSDVEILNMLQKLVCHPTQCQILAERSFLKTLGGGCSAPVAVHSVLSKVKSDSADSKDTHDWFEFKITGSVWSLDGKTEIKATKCCDIQITENGQLDDYPKLQDDGEQPTKKRKLSPPLVIDDTEKEQNIDITDLIKAGSSVQKCPHLMKELGKNAGQHSSPMNLSSNDSCLKCPLNFQVGQDVMGQCPYFSGTSLHPNIEDIANKSSIKQILPDLIKQHKLEDGKIEEVSSNIGLDLTKVCPGSTVENKTEEPNENQFCGLFRHQCWKYEVLDKCEQLGTNLALDLIKNGALPVMECAQKTIREKN